MIQLLHCADLHLDSPFLGVSHFSPDMAILLRKSIFHAFTKLVDLAIANKVDLLTVGGDVYDSADHGLHSLLLFTDQLKRLSAAGIHCCIVTGNHDPLYKRRKGGKLPEGCYLFGAEESVFHFTGRDGTDFHIYGISHGKEREAGNLAKKIIRIYENLPGISLALLHCNVGGAAKYENYAPCTVEELKNAPFDAWLLGHVHEKRIVSATDPLILYPGNIQGRHIGESGKRGGYLVALYGDTAPEIKFLPVSPILWYRGETRIDGLDSLNALMERLDEDFEKLVQSDENIEAWIVHWSVMGQGEVEKELNLHGTGELFEEIQARWLEKAPAVYIEKLINRCRPSLDMEEISKQNNFLSMLVEIGDMLLAEEPISSNVRGAILAELEKPALKKWLPELQEKVLQEPDFLRELIKKGTVHALNAMMEEKRQ